MPATTQKDNQRSGRSNRLPCWRNADGVYLDLFSPPASLWWLCSVVRRFISHLIPLDAASKQVEQSNAYPKNPRDNYPSAQNSARKEETPCGQQSVK